MTCDVLLPSDNICGLIKWSKLLFHCVLWFVSMFFSFLNGTCMVILFDLVPIEFFFFYHFSLIHLNLQVDPQKIHSKPSFSFIFRFSPCSFNCNFFILKKYFKLKIIFNLILQFFLSPIFLLLFSYLGWFIKLIFFCDLMLLHFFLSGLILFFYIIFLDWFFYHLILSWF